MSLATGLLLAMVSEFAHVAWRGSRGEKETTARRGTTAHELQIEKKAM